MADLHEMLESLVLVQGSDLHLKVGSVPHIRVAGELRRTPDSATSPADIEAIVAEVLPLSRSSELVDNGEISFAHGIPGLGRFRINIYRQRGTYGLSIRWIYPGARALDSLGLPGAVVGLSSESPGLVILTGPPMSGKSTTAAAMIDHINTVRSVHVVTLEDPIEVLVSDKLSIVSQRELGVDIRAFADAMRGINRLDPDVIFVSDLADAETVRQAVAAAAGRLVIVSVTAVSMDAAVRRLVTFFSEDQQAQVRHSIASTVKGIVHQRLIARTQGRDLLPVAQVLVRGDDVYAAIVQGSALPGGGDFDAELLRLVQAGEIESRAALVAAQSPRDLAEVLHEETGLPVS